jgi:hypothetical protein
LHDNCTRRPSASSPGDEFSTRFFVDGRKYLVRWKMQAQYEQKSILSCERLNLICKRGRDPGKVGVKILCGVRVTVVEWSPRGRGGGLQLRPG